MTRDTDTRKNAASGAFYGLGVRALVFLGLTAAYVATAPSNHSISIDPYFYARMITEDAMTAVPHPRLMLWILTMQGLYQTATAFVPDSDPFRIVGLANAMQTALAVMLLARILHHDFQLEQRASWLGAFLFASSYAIWRYATEIEVYPTAALVSLVVVHMTFSLERGYQERPNWHTVRLAVLGGVAALIYQPIGIVSVAVIPLYLLMRVQFRQVLIYILVAAAIVSGGFWAGDILGNREGSTDALNFVFQTHELFPRLPSAMTFVAIIYALGSDILSANWILAFAPLHDLFVQTAPESILDEETYAAMRAGWLARVPFVTLPACAVLAAIACATAWRRPIAGQWGARPQAMVLWLALHGAMMTLLSPSGFEGWILALVPLSILGSVFVVAPCIAAGRTPVIAGLVGLFIVHNGLAGIGIHFRSSGDYFRARGDMLVARTGPDDLIVLATNWNLQQYLNYRAEARVVRIDDVGVEAARNAIAEILALGGKVVILDDVATPPATVREVSPELERDLAALASDYLADAARFATADAGWAFEIVRNPAKP